MAQTEHDRRRFSPLGIGIHIPPVKGSPYQARAFVTRNHGSVFVLQRVDPPTPEEAAQGIRFCLRELARLDSAGVRALSHACSLFQELFDGQD